MKLLLICETAIIEHIFTLVCKRLNIKLTIQKTNTIEDKFDLIVIDQSFIDDKFNVLKQHTKKLGAISSEELSFDKSRDFIIPRPFLPTKLESLIQEQVEFIKEENQLENSKKEKKSISSKDNYDEEDDVTIPILNFVNTLDEDESQYDEHDEDSFNYEDNELEEDESIVNLTSLKSGGILDFSELNKINDILREDSIQNEINLEKNDWKDISTIIDDALAEVKEYEFDLVKEKEEPYNFVLSNFTINELRPLLEKFDQTVIDKLSSGESVDIRLSLKD
uniref:hypothetical protein n=1 Tax=Aliarcobacter sp. TaxID=2321116 RepID=UPI004048174F